MNKVDFAIAARQDMIQYNMFTSNMLFDANIVSNRLITGLIVLRNNVEQVYKYLRVIASQEVDLIMIPPPPLRKLLTEAEKEMAHNPRLEHIQHRYRNIQILHCYENNSSSGGRCFGYAINHSFDR